MSGSFENPNASKIPYVNFSNRQLKRPKIYIRDMTDIRHDITEVLLKVALNTIAPELLR
jgi:hypothetical protein